MNGGDAKGAKSWKSGDRRGAAAAEGRGAEDLDQCRDCGNWKEDANWKSMKSITSAGLGNLLDWVVTKMGDLA